MKNLRKLISPKELALIMGVSRKFIYSLVGQKKLPYLKVGRLVRFNPDDVAKILNNKWEVKSEK